MYEFSCSGEGCIQQQFSAEPARITFLQGSKLENRNVGYTGDLKLPFQELLGSIREPSNKINYRSVGLLISLSATVRNKRSSSL